MTDLHFDTPRELRPRARILERELPWPPRLGWAPGDRRSETPSPLEGDGECNWAVLRSPTGAILLQELEASKDRANGRARVRLTQPLSPDPILEHPIGLMEDNGSYWGRNYWEQPPTSAVGAAWVTLGGVKCVRIWGYRCYAAGPEHAYLFLPEPGDREGARCCWGSVFPDRYSRFLELRPKRIQRILEHIGPPGEDDRLNLSLQEVRVRAHVPGLGVILSDRSSPTQRVQVVVRDPSTGYRHHITVPPRFGNPRSKTFQKLGNARARIRAAIAWTFGMKPEQYSPALEA